MTDKPTVKLTGTDSNVFSLLGRCTKALKQAHMNAEASELTEKVFASESYAAALNLMREYVDVK